jgi:hypothetical protein
MEEIIIDGVTIYLKNGNKYRKLPSGELRLVCLMKDCNVTAPKKQGYYCTKCLNELCKNDPNKRKKIIEDGIKTFQEGIKKLKAESQAELEKSKIIIDGIEIYIIDSIKYRKKSRGTLEPVCIFDKCNKFQNNGKYCHSHKNGTTIDSPDRQKEKEEASKKRKLDSKISSKKGDASELWVLERLKLFDFISDVSCIGYTGSKYDIEFKLKNDNEVRGIQVKTLTKAKHQKDGYHIKLKNRTYSANVLIIGVNVDRTRFVLGFFKDFKGKYPSFTFSNDKSQYRDNAFSDYNKFIEKLKTMLLTTDVCDKDCFSHTTKSEYYSLQRLSTKCNENGLNFQRMEESGSVVDCIINGYNIQHKSAQTEVGLMFQFNVFTRKSGIPTPYSDKDGLNYFIFEIIPFKNNFYIVPIKILIERGYIRTNSNTGKLCISIPNPKTGNKDHWINEYLNKFSLLTPKKNINM